MDIVQKLNPFLEADNRPVYKPGDKVWIIRKNRAAGFAIFSVIYHVCSVADHGHSLVHAGYKLSSPIFPWETVFQAHELYASREAAERDVAWHPVEDFSEEYWDDAAGNPQQINAFHEAISKNQFEGLNDLPPNELITNFGSYRNRDEIEHLLHQCRNDQGLMERDRRRLSALLNDICPCCRPKPQGYPKLNYILKLLDIKIRCGTKRSRAHSS
jgi:hypothetical protein